MHLFTTCPPKAFAVRHAAHNTAPTPSPRPFVLLVRLMRTWQWAKQSSMLPEVCMMERRATVGRHARCTTPPAVERSPVVIDHSPRWSRCPNNPSHSHGQNLRLWRAAIYAEPSQMVDVACRGRNRRHTTFSTCYAI